MTSFVHHLRAVALQVALTDGRVTGQEWITIALGAAGVGLVPNAPSDQAERRTRL